MKNLVFKKALSLLLVAVMAISIIPFNVLSEAHDWVEIPEKAPTRTENGYKAYQVCQTCGATTEIEVIPALGEAVIDNYNDFIFNLALLEEIAAEYVRKNPAKDPVALIIKYIRTGVERYNSGSWGIMAGYEDADFANFVTDMENMLNSQITDGNYLAVTGLKNLKNFALPNGQNADIGHVFGAMDITYHNKGSVNHADVSAWAGDLVDLLEVSAKEAGEGRLNGTLEEMIATIGEDYFLKTVNLPDYPSFSKEDYDGDLDAYYIMNTLQSVEYGIGDDENLYSLAEIIMSYMTEELTDEYRAAYFMNNRLGTNGTRAEVRNAVYTEYLSNKLISTLEGTRDLSGANDLVSLRRAVCYAFADHLCKLAGDYVETTENPYYTVFSSSSAQLAPGITQKINFATSADGKQMVYYIATGDITRGDVHVFANYANNDPTLGWEMQRVEDQANAAQKNHGDPNSANYIPNYNVIASVNADGFNMSTGEPSGLLIMDGKEYHGINKAGFFGITKDGKAIIGTTDEYNQTYKDQLKEAVGGFGTMLIMDGEIAVSRNDNYYTSRASRTAVGITKTGKVVFMVLDGRQEPFSCGGSMEEIAQIMFEAGCVYAVNLDGGGSSTFVARQPGDDNISVVNRPSDGFARSVSTSLLMVSTAPSSTEFDHAIIESDYKYATIGTPIQMNGKGISPAGNETELPEGYTWAVSNNRFASIDDNGVFTGLRNGTVEVYMMLDGNIIGMTEMNVVIPENVYFTRTHMDAVYGANTILPVAASYNNKPVAIKNSDINYSLENENVGTITDNVFVGNQSSGVKVVKITASWKDDESICGTITLNMYKQGENTFDFSMATGGDRQFAWLREVTNSTTVDNITYTANNLNDKMTTSYVFAIDMTQIPIPSQLSDLIYMLPGADMENATAWNFLLQLAERVSVLTEITATIDFDDNFVVDIEKLNIKNEYFSLTSCSLDETTNTLTLKLNWIDQTKAIDPATANPLCMLSGIKLTPKDDANWDSEGRLNIVNSGNLSYKAYLRANALYSFAQKPENQEIYGLVPFVNPNLPSETGAYFGATYVEFEDSYTMVYSLKEGWTVEEGGFAYYQDGQRLLGVNKIDGYYYDFGENGINLGQTKYTGFIIDENGKMYTINGVLVNNRWIQIEEAWYHFGNDYKAYTGDRSISGRVYHFGETGAITEGQWFDVDGYHRYYFGPNYYYSYWGLIIKEIDGVEYGFDENGDIHRGYYNGRTYAGGIKKLYLFDENGVRLPVPQEPTVIQLEDETEYRYIVGGELQSGNGLVKVSEDYYYVTGSGLLAKDNHYISPEKSNGYGFVGYYQFDEVNAKMVFKDGVVGDYYYVDGVIQKGLGLVKVGEDYYYVTGSGLIAKDNHLISQEKSNGFGFVGYYQFDENTGKMLFNDGIIGDYYYVDGVIQKGLGLIKVGEDYYYVTGSGLLAKDNHYISPEKSNGYGFVGYYQFDETTGKLMLDNCVVGDHYYLNGVVQKGLGLIKVGEDYYYVTGSGLIAKDNHYISPEKSNGYGFVGYYQFNETTGKMVFKDGVVGDYYYVNGVIQKGLGLIKVDEDYYYVTGSGLLAKDNHYISQEKSNGYGFVGYYQFDETTGKMAMIDGIVGDYYYVDGVIQKGLGLVKVSEDYYYITGSGLLAKDNHYISLEKSNGYGFVGNYQFDEITGKMVIADGIVGDYYYVKGEIQKGLGLIKVGEDYYYVTGSGLIAKDNHYISEEKSNGFGFVGYYQFDETTGIMVQ